MKKILWQSEVKNLESERDALKVKAERQKPKPRWRRREMNIVVKVEWRYVLDWLRDNDIHIPSRLQKEFMEVLNNSLYSDEEKP